MLYFFENGDWHCFPILKIGSDIADDKGAMVWVKYLIPDCLENREIYGEGLPFEWGSWFDPRTEIVCPD